MKQILAFFKNVMRFLALLLVGLAGCSIFAPGKLSVTASAADTVASPGDPVTIEVTVRNVGDARVEWGRGSSTCQLDLLVRVGGQDYDAIPRRGCTADLVSHGLEPGESRREALVWDGSVSVSPDSIAQRLEPGTYEVRGAAGRVATSEPVMIRLTAGS